MTTPIDIAALRSRLREYDPELPKCKGIIEEDRNHAPDFVSEEERAEWNMTFHHPCCRPEGHEGPCRNTRHILGWPGRATLTTLLDEVERLRGERAAVVAWLHAEAKRMYAAGQDRPAWFTLSNRAERIEGGEHRREEER